MAEIVILRITAFTQYSTLEPKTEMARIFKVDRGVVRSIKLDSEKANLLSEAVARFLEAARERSAHFLQVEDKSVSGDLFRVS